MVTPVGLVLNEPGAAEGYTLFVPRRTSTVYLMDHLGQVVHTWDFGADATNHAKLLENGNLLANIRTGNRTRDPRLREIAPDGNILWEYQQPGMHHDLLKLPNGNALILARGFKTREEAIAAGANPQFVGDEGLEFDYIVEVRPIGKSGGEVVWQWSIWDHLVQDFDPAKPNYGQIAEHPERIDLNYNLEALYRDTFRPQQDWTHGNAIGYNATLEQIVFSPRHYNELWIIDHSTTMQEAVGRRGGRSGMGGDLLYRWGNPAAYGRGNESDQQLFWGHDTQWIEPGLPGAGNILVFSNGDNFELFPRRFYSSVDEIVPPLEGYVYQREPYPPTHPVWTYTAATPTDFYASRFSSAQRLPNGNTLICDGPHGTFFQVTPEGKTVWKYINPVINTGAPLRPGEAMPIIDTRETPHGYATLWANLVFRAYWYAPDYPGLQGLDLTPKGTIERPP